MTARRLQRLDLALQLGLAPDRLVAHLPQRGQFALERLQPRLMLVEPVVLLGPALALVRIEMRAHPLPGQQMHAARARQQQPRRSRQPAQSMPQCHRFHVALGLPQVTKRNKLNDARGLAEHLEESLSTCRHPPPCKRNTRTGAPRAATLAGIAFNQKPPEP